MRSTAVYEAYFQHVLICRGSIEDIAEALFISVKSARVYASTRGREGIEIIRLPSLYEAFKDGILIHRESCQVLSYELGVSIAHIRRAASEGRTCAGYEIRKYRYPLFMMDEIARVKMLHVKRSAKAASPNGHGKPLASATD